MPKEGTGRQGLVTLKASEEEERSGECGFG